MKTNQRKSVFMELKSFCYFSKEDDYIELTEWINGEGYDIIVNSNGNNQFINLTRGQLTALIHSVTGFDSCEN